VKKADLYVEGARLPEHLSRLIFLEGMIAGRRVLEVGSRSPAVARFLLELGASRVVCAVDDRALLERLRDDNSLDRVDYRAVRPAGGSRPPGLASAPVLPGDDGAFDLVIDFSLPEALAAGLTERLTDIQRLLSEDGFAVTALPSAPSGLAALLPGDQLDAQRVGYRTMADALRGNFGLVQVYFQSLMLGYLFGSFDHEPDGSGIAPQTTLMGDEPEPAGAYVFTFGNAIPVIEDVCLVQMPFDALIDAIMLRRAQTASLPPPAPALAPALGAADFGDRTELGVVAANAANEELLAEMLQLQEGRIAELELALRDAKQSADRAAHEPAPSPSPGPAADGLQDTAAVARLAVDLDDAVSRAVVLEQAVSLREAELARAMAARDELRVERDVLAEQIVSNDGARTTLGRQVRELESELIIAKLRIEELEDLAVSLDSQRSSAFADILELKTVNEGERLRANAEREMLEAAVAETDALIADLQGALEAAGINVRALRGDDGDFGHAKSSSGAANANANANANAVDDTSTVASRLRASLEQRFAAAEERALRAEAAVTALEARLVDAEASRDAARTSLEQAMAAASAAADDNGATADALAEAMAACEALDARLADADASHGRRTAEAVKLAAAVTSLMHERGGLRRRLTTAAHQRDAATARADIAEGRLDGQTAEVATLGLAIENMRAELQAAVLQHEEAQARTVDAHVGERRQHEERRRADQRQLEETRRHLSEARDECQELLSQRTVLQQALVAREQVLAAIDDDMASVRTEFERAQAQVQALLRRESDLTAAAESLSLEVQRLHGVTDENTQRALQFRRERDDLAERLAAAEAARAIAEEETQRFLELVEETEAGAARERATWHGAHDAEMAALRADVIAASARASEAEEVLTRSLDASRQAADDAAASRAELERDHAATRDELAELTTALLALEAQVAEERAGVRNQIDIGNGALQAARRTVAELTATLATTTATTTAALAARDEALATTQNRLGTTTSQLDVLKTEFNALHKHLEESRAVGEAQAAALKAQQAEAVRSNDVAVALAAEREALRAAVDNLTRSLGEAAAGKDASGLAVAQLTTALAAEQAALGATRAELAAANDVVAALGSERTNLLNDVETLQASVADVSAQSEARGTELARLTTALATEQAALGAASTALTDATDKVAAVGAERDALSDDVTRLTTTLAAVTAEIEVTTTALHALHHQHDTDRQAHARTAAALEEQLSEQRTRLTTSTAELEALRDTLSASTTRIVDLEERNAALVADLEGARARAATLTAEHGELTALLTESGHEVEGLQRTLSAAESERQRLAATAAATRLELDERLVAHAADVDANHALAEQLSILQQAFDVATADHARLDAAHGALQQEAAARADRLAELDTALARARDDERALGAASASLQLRLDSADADQQDLRRQHEALEATHAQQGEALATSEALVARLTGDLHQRDEDLRAANLLGSTLGEQVAQAREDLARLAEIRVRLDSDVAALFEQLQTEENRFKATDDARAALATTAETLQAQVTALEARAADLAAARDVAESTARALQERLDEAHAVAARHGDAADVARAEAASLREQLTSTEATRERLAGDLAAAIDAARIDAAALRERLTSTEAARERLAGELAAAVDSAHTDAAALREQLTSTEAERERLAGELAAAVDAAARDGVERDQRHSELTDQLGQLSAERDELAGRLDRADADLTSGSARSELLVAERELLSAALGEARSLLDVERARGDLFAEELHEAATAASAERARGDLFAAHLDEARHEARGLKDALLRQAAHVTDAVDELTATVAQLSADADGERARAELLGALLDEARTAGTRLVARGEELAGIVDELQRRAGSERARGDTFAALLDEAQGGLTRERARGDAFAAQLDELQSVAAIAQARGDGLSAVVDEARLGWSALSAREQSARDELERMRSQLAAVQSEASERQESLARERTLLVELRGAVADASALNESRASELAGLKDALATVREDGADAIASLEEQCRTLAADLTRLEQDRDGLLQALAEHPDALHRAQSEGVAGSAAVADLNADLESATAQRDAAVAAVDTAREATRLEQARRTRLEDEMASVRLELERVIADAARQVDVVGDTTVLRDKLEAAEKMLRQRDEKIAEQAERINRLTERIVRSDGLR